jgi:hypothetical protein
MFKNYFYFLTVAIIAVYSAGCGGLKLSSNDKCECKCEKQNQQTKQENNNTELIKVHDNFFNSDENIKTILGGN